MSLRMASKRRLLEDSLAAKATEAQNGLEGDSGK